MVARKSSKPASAQLREAFKTDLAACWQQARSLRPKEMPYAFALYGLEGTPHLYPYVLTEEGLTQVAKRYVAQGSRETVEEARKELRYSMEDSPYSTELEDKLPNVDRLMEPIEHTLDETEGYAMLAKAAMEAFAALDKQGVFGKGKQREQLLLMIDTSLAQKDWSLPSVKRLNPRVAVKRYENETRVEGDYVGPHYFQLSADGRLLCYKSYREVDPRTGKVFDDLVVCDVAGLSVKRRWCISSRDTDVYPNIACAPDGSVLVMETSGDDDHYETKLTRYAKGDRSRKTQAKFPGEVSLAFSSDGSRVAMHIADKMHFLDEKLQIVASHRAAKGICLEHFLKSGDLLGVANRRIMTMDARGKWRTLPYLDSVRWISLNSDETLCTISIIKGGLACEQKPKDQYGFKLLSFPKMKLLRSFQIPAHQLIKATLSPDGKLVAAEASECGKRNTFIVVFDVKTCREIARRKVSSSTEKAFLPRGNVLVMTISGHMKSEPIILWKIPV